jgi:carboxymethylenebutenolidase
MCDDIIHQGLIHDPTVSRRSFMSARRQVCVSDAKSYLSFLDAQPQTNKKKKMGVQGYCMGGPPTFRAAATRPDRIGAAATFHGGGLVTDKPDSPYLLIPEMKAEVLCCVADNDDERDPAANDKLKEAFAAAHLKATMVYDGCNHGWTVRGSQVYNEAGAVHLDVTPAKCKC